MPHHLGLKTPEHAIELFFTDRGAAANFSFRVARLGRNPTAVFRNVAYVL